MPRHDSIFKALLRSFFADLLWLAVPDLAGQLDLARPVFLDKEFFTARGGRRELDLLVRVSFLERRRQLSPDPCRGRGPRPAGDGPAPLALPQSNPGPSRHPAPLDRALPPSWEGRCPGPGPGGRPARSGPGDFRYVAFGLARCAAGEYLDRPQPLAWGLAALMDRGALTRPELKLACLRRIAAADLDDTHRLLLVNCVETYLELNLEEEAEYAGLTTVRENREVKRMATTWSERLEAKGREEGREEGLRAGRQEGRQSGLQEGRLLALREVLLSLLEQRFGPLPEATRERVEAISSSERLTRLSKRVLTARSLGALRLQ